MSEIYKIVPPVQVVMPIGCSANKIHAEIDRNRFYHKTREGMARLYLEHNSAAKSRWTKVERIYVVRESQRDILGKEVLDPRWTQVVMPNECSRTAGSRRKWIAEQIPLRAGTVRINADADVLDIGTNMTYECAWVSNPLDFSRYLSQWVLQFSCDYACSGVTFAGFNDRENRPGVVSTIYTGHPTPAQYGYAYFKEPLTFEQDCKGKYPADWDFKEGAYRILDAIRRGDKTARYFPVVHSRTRTPDAYESEEYTQKLIDEFGRDVVLKRPPKGLNLQASGTKRNKKRKELQK